MQGNSHWTVGKKTRIQCHPPGQVNLKSVSAVVKIETLTQWLQPVVAKPPHAGSVLSRLTSLACLELLLFWWEGSRNRK